jgi:hypothetical protein
MNTDEQSSYWWLNYYFLTKKTSQIYMIDYKIYSFVLPKTL